MPEKILVFTKLRLTAKLLNSGLEKRGFTVSTTGSQKRMLAWASAVRADFLVVDASDGTEDWPEFCKKLRRRNEYAHIILAVPSRRKSPTNDIDASFAAPITLRKVLRRIKALSEATPRYLIRVADVVLDPKDRIVYRGEHEAHLTPKETRLLRLLMLNAGTLVPREEIMKKVWDTEYTGDMRTIDVHIRWLRKKIEPAPSKPKYIRTVRREGYWFDASVQQLAESQVQ